MVPKQNVWAPKFIGRAAWERKKRGLAFSTGYWILDTGYWILDTGYWILDIITHKDTKARAKTNGEMVYGEMTKRLLSY